MFYTSSSSSKEIVLRAFIVLWCLLLSQVYSKLELVIAVALINKSVESFKVFLVI